MRGVLNFCVWNKNRLGFMSNSITVLFGYEENNNIRKIFEHSSWEILYWKFTKQCFRLVVMGN